ncbi:hypothetical protein [Ktedonobacter sp. SOSP1-52]
MIQGDLDQLISLRNALESVYGVFSVRTSFSEGALRQKCTGEKRSLMRRS